MILSKIREATTELHHLVENNTIMSSFNSGEISLADYILILQRFYEFLDPFENELQELNVAFYISEYERRRKKALLIEDLKQLKGSLAKKLVLSRTKVENLNEAVGALYVMEGSTLGGVQISKQLQSKLLIFPHNGGSFFYGYGPDTGKMWKSFLEDLKNFSINQIVEQEIVAGAVKTFKNLYTCLQ